MLMVRGCSVDAGQAAAYMQLTAWELGIASCLATIYKYNEARELLSFPDNLQLRIAISFGYPQVEEELTRSLGKAGRRIFSEVVHYDTWQACERYPPSFFLFPFVN